MLTIQYMFVIEFMLSISIYFPCAAGISSKTFYQIHRKIEEKEADFLKPPIISKKSFNFGTLKLNRVLFFFLYIWYLKFEEIFAVIRMEEEEQKSHSMHKCWIT